MFDLSKITETILKLFGTGTGETIRPVNALDFLQNPTVDPGPPIGMSQTEMLELLERHGIDTSQLGASQLAELLQGLGADQRLSGIASGWFEGEKR